MMVSSICQSLQTLDIIGWIWKTIEDNHLTLMTPGFVLKALPFVVDGEADTINSIDLAQVSELLGEKIVGW